MTWQNGVMHVELVKGSFCAETFSQFIENLLGRMNRYDPVTHPPNSVIVLDNCQIHRKESILQMIEER
jgi:hypothetical protein